MSLTTADPPRVASYLIDCAKQALRYGEMLVKDIPAAQFAHKPHPTMNHPAFCIGHLSLYPNRVLTMIGQGGLVVERAGYPELFKAGVPCVEQDGRYPAKDEVVAYYVERHLAAIAAVGELPDEAMQRENPAEGRFKEMFPTIGSVVNFLLNSHHMSHLGQVSAWRRAVGLAGVM